MNGLAKLLKSLFPQIDWTNPKTALQSIVPGVDPEAVVNDLRRLGENMRLAAERLDRMEAALARMEAFVAGMEQMNGRRNEHPGTGLNSAAGYERHDYGGIAGIDTATGPANRIEQHDGDCEYATAAGRGNR